MEKSGLAEKRSGGNMGKPSLNVVHSRQAQKAELPALPYYAGIFLTSGAVLLFEVGLTRVFAVMLWAHLAFMVVGTALFGFGLSGVYLALRGGASAEESRRLMPRLCLMMSAAMLFSYAVINNVPFEIWNFEQEPINYLYLGIWYICLVIPFFFAGLVIARLLSGYPARSARLYGVDLLGAAAGSLLFIPIIKLLGGEGTVFCSALIGALAALVLSAKNAKREALIAVVAVVALAVITPNADRWFAINQHQAKRGFGAHVEQNMIHGTKWSPISRVDIAYYDKSHLKVWIDGGTNDSIITAWNGDVSTLEPQSWHSVANVYSLKQGTNPRVMIIGPSGGKEVLFALSYGVTKIDAVEMDPSIADFTLRDPYVAKFMGNLYTNSKVNFVNDEGRSYLRRQPQGYYDVIQFVNNYTPVAIAAGALNLSETYLLTRESFHDFFDHLSDNGVIALHRGATLRVALTAMEAMRERGIANPEDHIVITNGEVPYFEGLFIKMTPWTFDEVLKLKEYMKDKQRVHRDVFAYHPFRKDRTNIYTKVITTPYADQPKYYTSLGINLFPATDDQPFMEHFLQLGRRVLPEELPKEFKVWDSEKWLGLVPRGDFPYVVILAESAFLSLLFLGLPLYLRARHAFKAQGFWHYLGYYAALGFGFIVVEICLMKRYALFLGNPAYSLTTILVALLLGAGVGSIVSERLGKGNPINVLKFVVPGIAVALLAEMLLFPTLSRTFLYLSFSARVLVASLMLFPVGFLMGMPFSLGMRTIDYYHEDKEEARRLVAWAWGINAYTTVIGSAATVFIALYLGFKAALFIAICTYLLGFVAMWRRKSIA